MMTKKPSIKRRLRLWLESVQPDRAHSRGCLGHLRQRLTDPLLWHFNRYNVAKGAALGLFVAFIPLPIQTILASIGAIIFRVNLPIAVALTWLTNPFTFVPILYLSYRVGSWFLPNHAPLHLPHYATDLGTWDWLSKSGTWLLTVGKPILIGTPIVALTAAALGYYVVMFFWRMHTRYEYRKRKQIRLQQGP